MAFFRRKTIVTGRPLWSQKSGSVSESRRKSFFFNRVGEGASRDKQKVVRGRREVRGNDQ